MHVVFFHHALGLTESTLALADLWRRDGHTVSTPDLYDGHVFSDIDSGLAYMNSLDDLLARAENAVADLGGDVVYAGQSMGVMCAQRFVHTKPAARGALFSSAFIDPAYLPGAWPDIPALVLGGSDDEFFVGDGDLAAAQAVARETSSLQISLYPTADHFLNETPLHDDPLARHWLEENTLAFLERVDSP